MLRSLAALAVAILVSGSSQAGDIDEPAQTLPLDGETVINGVQVACTGVGETRNDPKWAAYPIRVEFSDARNWYMTDAVAVLLDGRSHPMLMVRCDGPWLLLKPPAGAYAVYAELADSGAKPRSAKFTVGRQAQGQKRVVLQFPDA